VAKKKNKKNDRNRNKVGAVIANNDGTLEFGSDHTFKIGDGQVLPGKLFKGMIVTVVGTKGTFKVVAKKMDGKKLKIVTERLASEPLRMVKWVEGEGPGLDEKGNPVTIKATQEVYGVEAICEAPSADEWGEFLITHRGNGMWVRQIDCLPA
jgi:hypothetical protein